MHFLKIAALIIAVASAAVLPKNGRSESHATPKKESIEHEINEALKEMNDSHDFIVMTAKVDDTPNGFFDDMDNFFSGMFSAIQNSKLPFFGENGNGTLVNETDFLTRTRNELKDDVEVLRGYVTDIRSEFNEMMASSKHQELKAMLLGALSAVCVLIVYTLLCRFCRRRSRMNQLASFANDGFSPRDNESLLPTKEKRGRFPSNSDEDI